MQIDVNIIGIIEDPEGSKYALTDNGFKIGPLNVLAVNKLEEEVKRSGTPIMYVKTYIDGGVTYEQH